MSRIGNWPISIPKGIEINISKENEVSVKGPLGELKQKIDSSVEVKTEDDTIVLSRSSEAKQVKSMHGMYRALLANMVQGVSEGFEIELELMGVGFRASNNGQILELALGFSHTIYIELPKEIQVESKTERGKNPYIKLKSADKQLVGQVAAKIRSLRKPEPFKGKGVRYKGEYIRRKAGKAAAAAK